VYYNSFRRYKDEETRYCWQEETLTFNNSLESSNIGESQREVMLSCNIGLSTIYDTEKQKDQLGLFIESSESVKDLFKQQTLE
jgi:hypothetical protein